MQVEPMPAEFVLFGSEYCRHRTTWKRGVQWQRRLLALHEACEACEVPMHALACAGGGPTGDLQSGCGTGLAGTEVQQARATCCPPAVSSTQPAPRTWHLLRSARYSRSLPAYPRRKRAGAQL